MILDLYAERQTLEACASVMGSKWARGVKSSIALYLQERQAVPCHEARMLRTMLQACRRASEHATCSRQVACQDSDCTTMDTPTNNHHLCRLTSCQENFLVKQEGHNVRSKTCKNDIMLKPIYMRNGDLGQ